MAVYDENIFRHKSGLSFPKFRNDNAADWAEKMDRLFDYIDCQAIIDNTEQIPDEGTPEWWDHDIWWRQAAVAIAGATSQPLKSFRKDKKAPHEIWQMVKKHVDSVNTGIGRESIHREFHRSQPIPGKPIVEV